MRNRRSRRSRTTRTRYDDNVVVAIGGSICTVPLSIEICSRYDNNCEVVVKMGLVAIY
eukprot:SAG22_NODE_3033_length_2010_cov_1.672423_2_plen_58_part_00